MAKTGLFTFATHNVGDEMQSLAVLAHLDRVHAFIDRDHMASFEANEEFNCVFNSWFFLGNDTRVPTPWIKPVMHGFCNGRDDLFKNDWADYLKAHQPIGCRDHYTMIGMQRAGLEAYWAGCLTLFLGKAAPRANKPREGIVFIDVPPEAEAYIPKEITERALRTSTFPPLGQLNNTLDRWALTARLADLVANAELVVTRRLHAALPAASYGTPVVAIPDPSISLAQRRFSGFEKIMPTIFLDKIADELPKIDWRHVPLPVIPQDLIDRHAQFVEILRQRGIAAERDQKTNALDVLGTLTQRILNRPNLLRPGHIRLRLHDRVFDLGVDLWTEAWIDIELKGFPGLSKFDFSVEVLPFEADIWQPWGKLADLLLPPEAGQ